MKIIIACAVSFVLTALFGRWLVPALRKLKAGQSIREDGPTWHMSKQGTPTMGGLMFIAGIGVTLLICCWRSILGGDFTGLYVFVFALVYGAIGYVDDYRKVRMHQNLGLTAAQKFQMQLAAAVAFLCLKRFEGLLTPNL